MSVKPSIDDCSLLDSVDGDLVQVLWGTGDLRLKRRIVGIHTCRSLFLCRTYVYCFSLLFTRPTSIACSVVLLYCAVLCYVYVVCCVGVYL